MAPTLLTEDEIARLSADLPGWQVRDGRLALDVTAPSFLQAVGWVVAIAEAAEEMDHHPDIDIRWRTLHLSLATHSVGGLTELDVELAHRIDEVLAAGYL